MLAPSLPWALLAHRLGLRPGGYVNLECLLIGALSVFLPRRVTFILLILELLADVARAICLTYFLSLNDLLAVLSSLPELPLFRILEIFAGLALAILICAAVALVRPCAKERFLTAGGLLLFAAILTLGAFFAGQAGQYIYLRLNVAYFPYYLVRAPLISLARYKAILRDVDTASRQPNSDSMLSASSHALAFLDSPSAVKSPDVVLIVVESWGLPLDTHLAHALTAPYDDQRIGDKYDVSYGTVLFHGGTVPGEARELCQSGIGFGIRQASAAQASGCLPTLLQKRGYKSFAIHGYSGRMFQRNRWYLDIGFDQCWFEQDFDEIGLPDCGDSFPGTCDASIAGWIGSALLSVSSDRPRFIYWVTLNSHLPVPAHPSLPDDDVCTTQPALQDSVALCSWFRLVRNVHQSVQQLALTRTIRPTVFVLVGDHAPPFTDTSLRTDFSATDVPYVLLTPKMAAAR
jgi:phosphoglycerol transferase MdoB-like AlkP superfamily enzyme